jgi:hypothetical protein
MDFVFFHDHSPAVSRAKCDRGRNGNRLSLDSWRQGINFTRSGRRSAHTPFWSTSAKLFYARETSRSCFFSSLQLNSQVDGPLSIIVLFVPRREIPEHEMPLLLSKSITALNPVFSWSNTDVNM